MLSRLREVRKSKGVKGTVIARSIGISKQLYCDIEAGRRRLSYGVAKAIACILDTTPDALFLEEEFAVRIPEKPTGTDGATNQ